MAVPSTSCLPAAPLRSTTRSRPPRPPASVSLPPPLPETLGVKAGACAVCWQPGARAHSPAGCPPSIRAPPSRYIRVTARPPARPVPCGALRLAPSPSSPLPSVRAAPALSPSAPALRGVRPGPAQGGGGSGSVRIAGRLGECGGVRGGRAGFAATSAPLSLGGATSLVPHVPAAARRGRRCVPSVAPPQLLEALPAPPSPRSGPGAAGAAGS